MRYFILSRIGSNGRQASKFLVFGLERDLEETSAEPHEDSLDVWKQFRKPLRYLLHQYQIWELSQRNTLVEY